MWEGFQEQAGFPGETGETKSRNINPDFYDCVSWLFASVGKVAVNREQARPSPLSARRSR
jgi:N12 class adenine-specific DNA methylase